MLLVSVRSSELIGPIAKAGELLSNRYFELVALILELASSFLYQIVDLRCALVGRIVQLGATLFDSLENAGLEHLTVLIELVAKAFNGTVEKQVSSQGQLVLDEAVKTLADKRLESLLDLWVQALVSVTIHESHHDLFNLSNSDLFGAG
jgi:hypothetical protein